MAIQDDSEGLALYSARHTFKGFIDDLKTLSERSRRIVMGHAAAVDTPGRYGAKGMIRPGMH
jgi:hypothetical protein